MRKAYLDTLVRIIVRHFIEIFFSLIHEVRKNQIKKKQYCAFMPVLYGSERNCTLVYIDI